MRNQTIIREFFLSGLSDLPALQVPLFIFFFLIYLLTLIWNLLIICLILTNTHLHAPMFFFLGNLASLDLCFSSVTVPRMLFDFHTKRRKITTMACITQVFFFIVFGISDSVLLAVMSYDRYTAICQPLHYIQIMSWKVCVQLVSFAWCVGFTSALFHTIYVLKLKFCESDVIGSFFCDLPQLFRISCSDIFINVLLIFTVGGFVGAGCLILTFLSYVSIFKTILKMQVKGNRSKVFSTCTTHLTVVFMFYGSGMFNYFQPSDSRYFLSDKVAPVFYPVLVPLLNPLIYSLRNQDLITVLQGGLRNIIHVHI